MSQGNVQSSSSQSAERGAGASLPTQSRRPQDQTAGGELVTEQGRTKIADAVVAKVAGMAAREIGGVHDMGAGMTRTLGSMRDRLPGGAGRQSVSRGVAVQVGERQAAIDLDLIVDYGTSIPDLATAVRDNVINEVEHMCGLDVVEVNIDVADIHVPGEESEEEPAEPAEPRVR
jgi:uncharacterized alkaline shock family protein YloU